jgi:hypothetical protein
LINRAKSLGILVTEVFLKNIRRLNYDRLFNDTKFENKRIASLIRELTWTGYFENFKMKRSNSINISEAKVKKEFNLKFGKLIPKVAEKAAEFGTTLWFSDEDTKEEMMNCLVASGQFTMCFNLLDYLEKVINAQSFSNYFEQNPTIKSELVTMRDNCLKDWKAFKLNPKHLL